MLKRSIIGLVLATGLAAAPGFAAQAAPAAAPAARAGGTVNDYTPAQEQRARTAATRKGYRVGKVLMSQDGLFNFAAAKGGKDVNIYVTNDGQVHEEVWNPPASAAAIAAAAAAAPAAPPRPPR